MNKKLGILAAAGLVTAVALTVACGDSSNTGGSGGSATTSVTGTGTTSAKSTTTGSGTTTTTHAASTGNGTTASTGTGPSDDCASYCSIITANCTAADKQYDSPTACMTACTAAALPAGMVTDAAGHTLGCHIYHAGAAATAPDVHCWHAGLPGYSTSAKSAPGPCEN